MKNLLLPLLFAATLAPTAAAQDPKPAPKPADKKVDEKVDFASQIWPILEARCTDCHAAPKAGPDGRVKKPKGGVILDTKDGIMASKRGKLLVAGKPEESLLYTPLVLPIDDEDRMPPPKAKLNTPLPKEQTDLIARWIREGAEFGSWTGQPATEEKPPEKADGKPAEKAGGKPGEKAKQPPQQGK